MPARVTGSGGPLTLAERKKLLVLACTADRAAWLQACRPRAAQGPLARLTEELLRYADLLGPWVPGRLGRWLRNAGLLFRLARGFGGLRRR